MRITAEEIIKKLNFILEKYNQKSRIIEYSGPSSADGAVIVLSNGDKFVGNEAIRIYRRLTSFKTSLWAENFDKIYNDKDTSIVKKIKKDGSSKGGKSCQKLHGDKIRLNLNNGNPWNRGLRGELYPYHEFWQTGKTKDTDERLKKLSENRKGAGNPAFGKNHTDEYKAAASFRMKQKILNGEFTPKSNNRSTHLDSVVYGKKFRSSWEAIFYYFNQHLEYEKLRISYNYMSKEHIYIVDFIDYNNKIVYEIKPKELLHKSKEVEKIQELKKWCNKNDFIYKLVTQDDIFGLVYNNYCRINLLAFNAHCIRKIKDFYEISIKKRNR